MRRGEDMKSRSGNGDALDDVFFDGIDVVFKLGGYGYDWR